MSRERGMQQHFRTNEMNAKPMNEIHEVGQKSNPKFSIYIPEKKNHWKFANVMMTSFFLSKKSGRNVQKLNLFCL